MQAPSDVASYASVGTEDPKGASFDLTNKLGKDISQLQLKAAGEGDYQPNMLKDGETIKSGETIVLNCPEIKAAEGGDVALKPMVDILITLSDGTQVELHQVTVYSIDKAAVRAEGDVAYIEFSTEESASLQSTLESEKAIAQQKADEAQQAEAQTQGDGEGEWDEGYVEEWSEPAYYEEPAYEEYVPPAPDDSAVGGGNEEACIDDVVIR